MKLLEQVLTKLARDRARLPAHVIARKGARYLEELALSSLYLRHCNQVGRRARVRGRPFIENLGEIRIGDDFILVSLFVQSHLVTGHEGLLEIGNSVSINFGAAISAHEHLKIGDRVRIGPYSIIMDSDYHTAKDRNERPTSPIVIEDDVWLAGRVSILKGTHIGSNSVITAGSVVSGIIPSGVIAGGVPARVLGKIDGEDPAIFEWHAAQMVAPAVAPSAGSARRPAAASIAGPSSRPSAPASDSQAGSNGSAALPGGAELQAITSVIAETFSLEPPVDLAWSRKDIAKWDSLGTLRLIMSLEERFGISIPEAELVNMNSVDQVCRIVHACMTSTA